jgi:FdhE protein
MTHESWDARIARAEQLAAESEAARELLEFYAHLLRAQKRIYDDLRGRGDWLPSGRIERDLPALRASMPAFLRAVADRGSQALVEEARALARSDEQAIDDLLLDYWRAPSDENFFAKAFLQPYARRLAESGASPLDRELERHERRCPFCGGRPQVSLLRSIEAGSESGGRELICATCLTVWPFRRAVCANCGEERPQNVGYFQSPQYEHVRVEACDTCRHYVKSVDLTRLGLAVPVVDDVASAALDVWARDQGYTKVELNLLGL